MTTSQVTVDRQYGAVLEGRWVPAPRFVLRRDRALAAIRHLPVGRVVEVGCGSGALLRELAVRGHECHGIETSPDALEVADQMLAGFPGARISDGPQGGWEGSFDTLLSFDVLEHIEDDVAALRQWVSWLKPGGTAVLSMPAHRAMWSPRDAWIGHYRRYDKADMLELAQAAGLNVQRLECYGFPLANFTHWLGNRAMRGQDYAGGAQDMAGATAASGTDRRSELRLFGYQRSPVGRAIMAAACLAQRPFLGTGFGDGYLMVATRP